MNHQEKDYLYEKMELTSKEYGKIPHHLIPFETDEDGLSLQASGTFGSMLLREEKCDDFNICHQSYKIKEDVDLYTAIDAPSLGLHFTLKNNIQYAFDGLPEGVILKHQYNMIYVPSLQYKYAFLKSEEYSTFSIHFTASYLERWKDPFPLLMKFLDKAQQKTPTLISKANLSATPEMLAIIHSILRCTSTGTLKKMFLQAKILELLMLSLQHLDPSMYLPKPGLRRTDIQKIQEAKDYLVDHMENPCSLRTLAHQVGINVFKLKKGFRQLYGTTVFNLLTEERMQRARSLLLESDMFINEISMATGYKNLSNFTAAFKKRFGYPPSAIKQSIT
jgi:AraC-like DNA-binding protein